MTSISFHGSNGNKVHIVAEKVIATSGVHWIDIKILDGIREIGEITVFNATNVEMLEAVD